MRQVLCLSPSTATFALIYLLNCENEDFFMQTTRKKSIDMHIFNAAAMITFVKIFAITPALFRIREVDWHLMTNAAVY